MRYIDKARHDAMIGDVSDDVSERHFLRYIDKARHELADPVLYLMYLKFPIYYFARKKEKIFLLSIPPSELYRHISDTSIQRIDRENT